MRLARLLTVVLVAGSAAAQTADLNVISQVEVREVSGSVVVTVSGSRPPSFTTFSMMDPPRFVVDLSESTFRGVPEETGGAGNVRLVRSLSFGAGPSAVARVTLVFASEVEPPDVQAQGASLVVRVSQPPGAPPAVGPAAPPPAPPAPPRPPPAGAGGGRGPGGGGRGGPRRGGFVTSGGNAPRPNHWR